MDSKWPTLEHFLIESNVRRLTFGEWDAQNKLRTALRKRRLDRVRVGHGAGFKRWLLLNLIKGKYFLEDYNKVALVGFAVSCKALEWWYATGEEAAKLPGQMVAPPPQPTPHPEARIKLPKSPKLCPICK